MKNIIYPKFVPPFSCLFILLLVTVNYPGAHPGNHPHMAYEIPVLCYHQIRDWKNTDPEISKAYIMPLSNFRAQMKMLNDSGYHAVLPQELAASFQDGIRLPYRSIIISFDDGTEGQYNNALPELDKYSFKAVFFIPAGSIGRPLYMSRAEVRQLCDQGHEVGSHTWDHKDVTHYQDQDWDQELAEPARVLEEITGHPIKYFAYPYGCWNLKAVEQLKKNGYEAAFQIGTKPDRLSPLFTIRRISVVGKWNANQLYKAIRLYFREDPRQQVSHPQTERAIAHNHAFK